MAYGPVENTALQQNRKHMGYWNKCTEKEGNKSIIHVKPRCDYSAKPYHSITSNALLIFKFTYHFSDKLAVLFSLFLDHEDRSKISLRKVGRFSTDYTVLYPR
jgi:hypothetical protein